MDALTTIIQLVYLLAAALFITALHDMNSPETARKGNVKASAGMLAAVIATLMHREIVDHATIFAGIGIGSVVGAIAAYRVKMTAMPQMVALLNGFGGGASLLVAAGELLKSELAGTQLPLDTAISIQLALLIGAVTFSGSMIAYAKLQELMTGRPIT